MIEWITLDDHLSADHLLDGIQKNLFRGELRLDIRMDIEDHAAVLRSPTRRKLPEIFENFVDDRPDGLDVSLPVTIGAGFSQKVDKVLPDPFPGHFHQTQVRDLEGIGAGLVLRQHFLKPLENPLPVFFPFPCR